MTNYEVIESLNQDGTISEHILIDNGDGSFTSMLKSTWDEQQKAAEQSGTL